MEQNKAETMTTTENPLAGLRRQIGGLRRFLRERPLGAAGGLVCLLTVICAIIAPLIAPFDPFMVDVPSRLLPPSILHLMGTDSIGRDIFSRIVYGSRISLYVGILSVGLATILATAIGISSGYIGGKYDLIMQRIVDALMSIPGLVLALIVMSALGRSLTNVSIAIAIAMTPGFSRVIRGSTLSIKENQYIKAAKAIGCGDMRITLVHILSNVMAPIIIVATASLGGAIIVEASLSFLGMGIPPPAPSWGAMLSGDARKYMEAAPWLAIFPGFAITIVVLAFNVFGDALRDLWDPRLRGASGIKQALLGTRPTKGLFRRRPKQTRSTEKEALE